MRRRLTVPLIVLGACGLAAATATTLARGHRSSRPYAVVLSGPATPAGVDVEQVVAEAAQNAFGRLPHRGVVRIFVEPNRPYAIGALGIGGYTGGGANANVHITYTSAFPRLRDALTRDLPGLVAHELHHSSRDRTGPGYGRTLGGAMVSEGLADHFAEELYPRARRPWDHALRPREERMLWPIAREELRSATYSHSAWFFGQGVTLWAGYTLGYDIVAAYLTAQGTDAAAAVQTPAAAILRGFRPRG